MRAASHGSHLDFLTRHRRFIPALTMLLCVPALVGGIELDDIFHAVHADEANFFASAFTFFGEGPRPAHVSAIDLPWWTDPGMRLDLCRPLAAATHRLDYLVWPESPWLMHLHSVAWYGLLVALVQGVYRAFGGEPRRAVLATLLFGVAQAHAMNVGWVSARNSIIGAVFVTLALLLHHRWRSQGWKAGMALGTASFAAALLANEGTVAGFGYLFAYAWFLDRHRTRFVALLPYLGAILAWRWWYVAAGYGAGRSGIYLDPLADPLVYAGRTFVHAADMLAARFGIAVLDVLGAIAGGYFFALLVGLPLLSAVAWLLRSSIRHDPTVRAWGMGTLLACATAGTVVPTDRGLMLMDIGGCLLLCELLLSCWRKGAGRGECLMGRTLFVLHLVLAPLLFPLRVGTTRWLQTRIDQVSDSIPDDEGVENRALVLLNVPSDLVMLYSRAQAKHSGRTYPGRVSYLYAGKGELIVERPKADVLVITSTYPWLGTPLDRMFRSDTEFVVGRHFETDCVTAEIIETDRSGLPVKVSFEIHTRRPGCRPIYMAWKNAAPEAIEVPEIGGSLHLDAVTLP